jgi:hypothetical protein
MTPKGAFERFSVDFLFFSYCLLVKAGNISLASYSQEYAGTLF